MRHNIADNWTTISLRNPVIIVRSQIILFVEFCRFPSSFRSPFYDHVNDVEEGYVELVRLMDTQSSTVNHGRRCVENYFLILHWKVRAKSILYFDFLALRWKRAVLRMKDSCYQPSFVDARGRWQPQLSKDVEQSFFLEFGDFLARVPDLVNAKQFSLDVDFDAAQSGARCWRWRRKRWNQRLILMRAIVFDVTRVVLSAISNLADMMSALKKSVFFLHGFVFIAPAHVLPLRDTLFACCSRWPRRRSGRRSSVWATSSTLSISMTPAALERPLVFPCDCRRFFAALKLHRRSSEVDSSHILNGHSTLQDGKSWLISHECHRLNNGSESSWTDLQQSGHVSHIKVRLVWHRLASEMPSHYPLRKGWKTSDGSLPGADISIDKVVAHFAAREHCSLSPLLTITRKRAR